MSDNEDERLDRAKRIRQMREGGDRQDESAEEEVEDGASNEGEDDAGPGGEDDGDHGNADEPLVESGDEDERADGDGDEVTQSDEPSPADDEEPSPEVNVPETAEAEPEDDSASLEVDDDVRAPLPDTEELEDALDTAEATVEGEDVADAETATPPEALDDDDVHEEETRVLEFKLGDEYYCLDIDYIEEIVKEETITRVPNTPQYVEGVVDLRGQITTILNPKVTIEKEDVTPGDLIVVFDSESFEDQGHIGWVVDDVRQVSPITDSEVNEPPVQEEYINGVIDRDDDEQFVIWTDPDMAMQEAE